MIVPWLQRADWPHWRRTVCRPLLARTTASLWLTCAEARGDTVASLDGTRRHEREELEAEARRFLRDRPAAWSSIATTKGFLGLGKRPRILVHDGDPYAACRVVDADFLRDAQQRLGSTHVLLAMPARDVIVAGTMDSTDELFAIASKIFDEHERPLSDVLFLANDGALHGVAERTTGPDKPPAPARAKSGVPLRLNLYGSDAANMLRTIVLDRHLGERGDPDAYALDGANLSPSDPFWLEDALQRARQSVMAAWSDGVVAGFGGDDHAWVTIPDHARDFAAIATYLASLPFDVADVSVDGGCTKALAIGPYKVPVGVGLAFRGTAHVASQRFLRHGGPWRAFDRGDVTVLQLHDLDADARTAIVQQRFALARLSDGLLPVGAKLSHAVEGYARKDGAFEVVLGDPRRLAQARLRDLCVARRARTIGETSFERVRFMFPGGRVGHHLHELWLRELEVHTIGDDGQPQRLDDAYRPPPIEFVRPFRFTSTGRDVLTIYPAYDEDEDARPGVPSITFAACPPALRDALSADGAPYYTLMDEEQLVAIAEKTTMSQLRDFVRTSFSPYFHVQNEHAAIAGDGTSRLRGLIAESQGWPDDPAD